MNDRRTRGKLLPVHMRGNEMRRRKEIDRIAAIVVSLIGGFVVKVMA